MFGDFVKMTLALVPSLHNIVSRSGSSRVTKNRDSYRVIDSSSAITALE